jgi:hypothetical protein
MSIDRQMLETILIYVGSGSFHLLPGKRIIQIPRITKSTPAPILRKLGGISLLMAAPNRTPSKEVRTSAPAEPMNTETRDLVSAEKAKVASWVLSPNSARKMVAKVVNRTLKSIRDLHQAKGFASPKFLFTTIHSGFLQRKSIPD